MHLKAPMERFAQNAANAIKSALCQALPLPFSSIATGNTPKSSRLWKNTHPFTSQSLPKRDEKTFAIPIDIEYTCYCQSQRLSSTTFYPSSRIVELNNLFFKFYRIGIYRLVSGTMDKTLFVMYTKHEIE